MIFTSGFATKVSCPGWGKEGRVREPSLLLSEHHAPLSPHKPRTLFSDSWSRKIPRKGSTWLDLELLLHSLGARKTSIIVVGSYLVMGWVGKVLGWQKKGGFLQKAGDARLKGSGCETAQSTKKPKSGVVLGNMYDRERVRAQAVWSFCLYLC